MDLGTVIQLFTLIDVITEMIRRAKEVRR
jgi:hypothetical protein